MNFDDLKRAFTREKIIRDFLVMLACMAFGIILFIVFLFLGKIPGRGTDIYFLLQNLGYFFVVSGIFIGYAAIHRGNVHDEEKTIKPLIIETAKKTHILLGILLGSLLAVFIVALVELIPVFLGYIPYAGPVIVALLSVPLFIVNFVIILAVALIWIVAPPMVAEGTPLNRLPVDFFTLARRRGLIILAYAAVILVVTGILFMPLLMAVRYSAGITRAVEWNIAPAYPQIFKAIMRPSYITDVITKIAPRTDPISVLQEYGGNIFNYIQMLGNFLKVLYGIMMAAIVSFIGALFSNLLSLGYLRIKKDILK